MGTITKQESIRKKSLVLGLLVAEKAISKNFVKNITYATQQPPIVEKIVVNCN
jgi:hypothetical protein